jgi:predicted nucleic acid-binding protein
VDAFDADVLIYAAAPDHPLGPGVRALLTEESSEAAPPTAIGSVLLLPEVLTKPLRDGHDDELAALGAVLSRLVLVPLDAATAQLATALGARHRLRAADAVHLATAVAAGADRFVTNNHRDFDAEAIDEIAVTYPGDLVEV